MGSASTTTCAAADRFTKFPPFTGSASFAASLFRVRRMEFVFTRRSGCSAECVQLPLWSLTVSISNRPPTTTSCANSATRSNLYRYAATQEEVFFALHSAKSRGWIEELAIELDDTPLPAPEFARIWAEATERHAGFLRCPEIIIAILESNVTLERLTAFRRDSAEMPPPVTDVLARQCGVDDEAAVDLYLRLLYQAPGLRNRFHATEFTREAMRVAGLPETRGSFTDAYAGFVEPCVE